MFALWVEAFHHLTKGLLGTVILKQESTANSHIKLPFEFFWELIASQIALLKLSIALFILGFAQHFI